jgi:hypothetical protein
LERVQNTVLRRQEFFAVCSEWGKFGISLLKVAMKHQFDFLTKQIASAGARESCVSFVHRLYEALVK